MSDITVQNLRAKVDEFLTLKENIKRHDSAISDINKELGKVQAELNEIMEAMDLDRFEGSKGKITRLKIDYVSNPATDELRQEFYAYLKDQGLFEAMVSVHHQKLNSFWKDQLAQAIEDGRELNIPGLEPKQRVEIRKTR